MLAWAVTLACFLLPVSNPDIFWHLSAARRMLADGAVPRADWLSYTMAGRAWTDFEWLWQLACYGALEAAGLWGFVLLKAAAFTAAAAALWVLTGLHGISLSARALTLLAWVIALAPANDLRPENVSLALFSLQLLALEALRLERWKPRPWALAAVHAGAYALWANCHPGFLYGLALVGLYAAADLYRIRRRTLVWAGPAAFAGTLLNPFGPGLYRVVFEHARELGELQRFIQEWQEPTIFSPWLAAFWLLLLAAFAALLLRFLQDREVPFEHLAAVCGLALSASSHARTGPYFTLAAAPLAALHFRALDWSRVGGDRARRVAFRAVAAALLAFFCVRLAPDLVKGRPFLPRFIPGEVARFLDGERAVLGSKRMLNPWHWGGYLGWELFPDYEVFCDGRYIFHPLLRPLREALETPQDYRAFLDRWGIDVVVQERTFQLFEMPIEISRGRKTSLLRPYYLAFLPRADWALAYWWNQGLLFVRRAAFPKAWVAAHEYRLLRPGDLRAAELQVREGLAPRRELAREAERWLADNPGAAGAGALRSWVEGLGR